VIKKKEARKKIRTLSGRGDIPFGRLVQTAIITGYYGLMELKLHLHALLTGKSGH